MLFAMKIKIAITLAALASPVALSVAPVGRGSVDAGFTAIPARPFQYRMAGDFSRDGKPAEAPLRDAVISGGVRIMTSQVTSREYAHCVDDGACPRIPHASGATDRPMVGVSWRDAGKA
jgi:formylglycine-generating enzyme required for sulfatase activity